MPTYKMGSSIAIIGGGPAGLSAAIRAAELGLRVDLYEKGKVGTGIKCAEGFIDTLGVLGRPEAGVLFKVEKAIFLAGKEYPIHLLDDCGLWIIDRSTWQRYLAERARKMGVLVKEDSPIAISDLSEMRDTYKYIIDTSGAPSVTSRLYGFVSKYLRNAALLAQYVIEGDFGYLGRNSIKVGYEPNYLGYYWIFPKGQNIANVGFGRFILDTKSRCIHLTRNLNRILKKEGLDGYRILRKISSFCPSNGVNRLVWGNILLAGDAAALASPLHGAGMDMACISGRVAAEAIASHQAQHYSRRLWKVVGKKITMEKRLLNIWRFLGIHLINSIMKRPALLRSIFFNKHPIPQIMGLGGRRKFY
jgi:digeranylgeranylglycerophospholipid reductase